MKMQISVVGVCVLSLAGVARAELVDDARVKTVLEERLEFTTNNVTSRVFGIVINADHEDPRGCHTNNVRDFYEAWKCKGFEDYNLFVFTSEDVRAKTSEKHPLWVNGHPTKNNLICLFAYLRKTCKSGDTYYVYLTGHGRRNGDEVFVNMDDLDLSGAELVLFLKGVKQKGTRFVVIADHCYSGGIIDKMKDSQLDYVCVCDTDFKHEVSCRTFMKPFLAAFKQQGVSLREAFQTAQQSLSSEEMKRNDLIPLYSSSGSDQ